MEGTEEPDVSAALAELGGLSGRAALVAMAGRCAVDAALRRGEIVADARDRYALPSVAAAPRLAHQVGGVLCLTSAALHHGWEVLHPPDRPHVLVPRGRRVPHLVARLVQLHRGDLHPDDRAGIATSEELTITQCARQLPYAEALTVADSALRHGAAPAMLARIAISARGPGAPRVREVAARADPRAASALESALRAITDRIEGLRAVPQVWIRSARQQVRPDLVDEDLRLVIEADSFAWHGDRAALRADCRRYDLLVADGWVVLRFAYEDVVHDPDWVRAVIEEVVARLSSGRDPGRAGGGRAARRRRP